MKSVDTLAHTLALWHNQWSTEPIPQACSDEEIAFAEARFYRLHKQRFPENLKRIYRRSNGLEFGGFLMVWPIKAEPRFKETIFQANEALACINKSFVFWGMLHTDLYVYDRVYKEFFTTTVCLKYHPVIERFEDGDEMIQTMLQRAWDRWQEQQQELLA